VSTTLRPTVLVLIVLFAAIGLSGCGLVSRGSPQPSICDGISSDIGPCGAAPSFAATTCTDLASEYGVALDRALLEVIRGPADVDGEAKSSRLIHAEVFVTTALTNRMISLGIIEECKMPDFLDAAEPGFSAELRAGVGQALFDGQPTASYGEFRERLAKVMSGIGQAP
jgi:hypothetical protein